MVASSSATTMAVALVLAATIFWVSSAAAVASNTSSSLLMDAQILLSSLQGMSILHPEALHGWNEASLSDPCVWTGVSCDKHNLSVIGLDLSSKELSGFISPNLGGLSHLQSLNLSLNSLSGTIPSTLLDNCSHLLNLSLSFNSLSGIIPDGISNCSSLTHLDLSNNKFYGLLPAHIGQLSHLQSLFVDSNFITTPLPSSLSNCTELQQFSLFNNSLTGPIPTQLSQLTKLEFLRLTSNPLTGEIPVWLILNCSRLTNLHLEDAMLSGPIPPEFGQLQGLQELWLMENSLSGYIPDTLGNLSQLTHLVIANNNLTGMIPNSLGQLSLMNGLSISYNLLSGGLPIQLANLTNLQIFRARFNLLSGTIPPEYGNMRSLQELSLGTNSLHGEIPPEISNCTSLVLLQLQENLFDGRIPENIGRLYNLAGLNLDQNLLTGSIPASLSNCSMLQTLSLGNNQLTGNIPSSAPWLSNVVTLSIPNNMLTGKVVLGGMQVATSIDLSGNNFTGSIPESIGGCVQLEQLNLSHNSFTGEIPSQFSSLQSLQKLDLSYNLLSGSLPAFLAQMKLLKFLNISFNDFEGSIPDSGIFQSLNASSLMGNEGLCGPILGTLCKASTTSHSRIGLVTVCLIVAVVVIVVVTGGIFCYFWLPRLRRHYGKPSSEVTTEISMKNPILNMTAQDVWDVTSGFSADNVIGEGTLSTVYKGILPNGRPIAVKRLKVGSPEDDRESQRSFVLELQTLGLARHRNLAKVLGFCADGRIKAVVLELMPNGNLDKQLHKIEGGVLSSSWQANMTIVMGVAQGLLYLHHECPQPIVHCDIKPSNILLDDDMEPHVADFGLARIVSRNAVMGGGGISTSNMRGTIGYIAPEYANTGRITAKGDVYSFGIVLLEMLTRRRPTSEMFASGEITLVKWVAMAWEEEEPLKVVSEVLLQAASSEELGEMVEVMKLALQCTQARPGDRPTMKEVVKQLVTRPRCSSAKAAKVDDDVTAALTFHPMPR